LNINKKIPHPPTPGRPSISPPLNDYSKDILKKKSMPLVKSPSTKDVQCVISMERGKKPSTGALIVRWTHFETCFKAFHTKFKF
jgi:hypothetical protein